MNILKTDGTIAQTRVAELKQISFLSLEEDEQGLLVTTNNDETIGVLFETNPVVTAANGKLIVKSTEKNWEFMITDIVEIQFGDTSNATGINNLENFGILVQENGVLLRDIPKGVKPQVYSIDGRKLPTPSFQNGELQLNRSTLGKGIFIVKVGKFSTKIQLH